MFKRLTFLCLLVLVAVSIPTLAQRPDAPTFGERGPHIVGTRDYTVDDDERPLSITVWYPALNPDDLDVTTTYRVNPVLSTTGNALTDAIPDDEAAPYPLVIFSHGNSGFRFQSLFFTEHLASWGFVVIALDHPTNTMVDTLNEATFLRNLPLNFVYRPQDVMRTIDYASELTAADGDLAGLIDIERVAVSGHSFGGYTALASGGAALNLVQLRQICDENRANMDLYELACFIVDSEVHIAEAAGLETPPEGAFPPVTDPRIKAVIALAPWNGPILDQDSLAYNMLPTMIIVGTTDHVTPAERDANRIFGAMEGAPRMLVTLENADHYVFVDACNDIALRLGLFRQCSDPVWDMARVHDLTNHFAVAFLRDHLLDDTEARSALQDEIDFVGVEVTAGENTTENAAVDILVPDVLSTFPHDTNAFTQGLLLHEGVFYESTGRYGDSTVRRVDPETGEVLFQTELTEAYFGEGLALVDDRLIQITWQEGTAFVYDVESLEMAGEYSYEGEGWGLCYDSEALFMSDGSSTIFVRDPQTFEITREFTVMLEGSPVDQINELECVGSDIYANIWQTDFIVRFDKIDGRVNAVVDARGLVPHQERVQFPPGAVLNGIAYDPDTDVFFITGKLWPTMFEVQFVPQR